MEKFRLYVANGFDTWIHFKARKKVLDALIAGKKYTLYVRYEKDQRIFVDNSISDKFA